MWICGARKMWDLWVHQGNPYVWFDERCWHLIILGALSWQVFKLNSPIFWGGFGKERDWPWGWYCQFGRFQRGGEANFSLPSRRSVAGNIESSIPSKNTSISHQNESIWGKDMEGLIQHPDGGNRHFFWKTLIDTDLQNTQWLLIPLGWWVKSGEPVEVGSYCSLSHIPGF